MSTKNFVFENPAKNVAELTSWNGYDIKDPYCVAAMTVVAMEAYIASPENGLAMLNLLKGPQPLSTAETAFLKEQLGMSSKKYLPRSYFNGATPDNDYTPSTPWTVTVSDNLYSDAENGYKKLFIRSGGADSIREVKLRRKDSTGEWFLWEHVGLLPGIRDPKSADPWA